MCAELRERPDLTKEAFLKINEDFISELERVAEGERRLEKTEGEIVPTIGLEVEVPEKTYASHGMATVGKYVKPGEFYKISEKFGVKPSFEHSTWEWAVDYSHSARVQSLIVHELIQAGFIDTEGSGGERKVKEGGEWSMHVNLKVPDRLNYKDRPSLKKRLNDNSDILTNAFTYAFSSPERLKSRKSNSRYILGKSAQKIKKQKSLDNAVKNEPPEDTAWSVSPPQPRDEIPEGRLEIRSLEVRDKTLYRLLVEIQRVASAMFASQMPADEKSKADEELGEIWSVFSGKVYDIIDSKIKEAGWSSLYNDQVSVKDNGGPLEFLDRFKDQASELVKKTWISTELRHLITETSIKIEKILKNKQ